MNPQQILAKIDQVERELDELRQMVVEMSMTEKNPEMKILIDENEQFNEALFHPRHRAMLMEVDLDKVEGWELDHWLETPSGFRKSIGMMDGELDEYISHN